MKKIPMYPAEKVTGLMLGLMTGDALGCQFNDMRPDDILPLELDYVKENPPKNYTDDTEMAISVFEEMVQNGEVDQSSLQNRFLERYSSWRRYGGGMLQVIESWRRGESIQTAASALHGGTGNYGNGAAMRVAPISAFFGINDSDILFEQVKRCATLTHTHAYGISGALLQAYVTLLALNNEPVSNWIDNIFKLPMESAFKIKMGNVVQCLEHNAGASECAREIGNGSEAIESVPLAIYAVLRYPESFTDAVFFAVSTGGDTDTIAAMAGAIAGALHGSAKIPDELFGTLDESTEGPLFVKELVRGAYQ